MISQKYFRTVSIADQELQQKLIECAFACEACAAACLREDNLMMSRCIELDRDCADICMLA
ncbi:MAG: hypothetical protein ACOYXT_07235, partial [Bacteroidota bacterium]